MSVLKSKRTEGKLTVLIKAESLADYTIQITNNENNFPKRYRWSLTDGIVKNVKEIFSTLSIANLRRLEDPIERNERKELQKKALDLITTLTCDVTLAYNRFQFSGEKLEHWTSLCYDLSDLIKKWRKSDEDRAKALIG